MAGPTTTATTNFSSLVTELVLRNSEPILAANYVHVNEGVKNSFVKGTDTLVFPAFAQFAANTTALTEGAPPTAQELTIATDTVQATQMGWTASLTDLAMEEAPMNLLEVASERIADQALGSMDVVVRDIIANGASVVYSNGSARSTVSATLSGTLVKQMATRLASRNVPRFPDNFYHAIIHPRQALDLMEDTNANGWLEALKYTNAVPLLVGEIGQFGGVRFVITSNTKVFATAGASSADVYSAVFYGPGAWGVGDLQTLRAYYTPPGGQSDPIHQRAIVGAKCAIGATLLDANGVRYTRLESAASSLS